MTLRRILLAGVLSLGLAMTGLRVRSSERPNVVLIVIDTLRADALGCYDQRSRGLTPELDALARRGVVFESVLAASSWTRPSVASMLTSRHPRSLGIYREKYDLLDDRFDTLAEVLARNGYRTVGVTANPNLNSFFNFQQGFDVYVDSDVVWGWMPPESGQVSLDARRRLPDSRHVLGRLLDEAAKRPAGGPMYLQATLMEVHEGWKLVRPEYRQGRRARGGPPEGYWDGVRQLSADVGRFVDRLSSLPGWQDTLFVVTSDHGQGLDDHPAVSSSRRHGLVLYESNVKVPLMLYLSGSSPGRPGRRARGSGPFALPEARVRAPVQLIDLMPTLLDYLGIAAPRGVEGRSLLGLLLAGDASASPPADIVSETRFRWADKIALYADGWMLVRNRDGHPGTRPTELQRLGRPANGLATDQTARHPRLARTLADRLEAWEQRSPLRAAVQPRQAPRRQVLDQLRAVGYLDDRD